MERELVFVLARDIYIQFNVEMGRSPASIQEMNEFNGSLGKAKGRVYGEGPNHYLKLANRDAVDGKANILEEIKRTRVSLFTSDRLILDADLRIKWESGVPIDVKIFN